MGRHLIHNKFIGAYVYAILVDGVVRYIGKGRRHRAMEHFRYARTLNRRRAKGEKIRARPFHNKLAKAMREGLPCSYEILAYGLDDATAYERERSEIASRSQLWNIQPGGFGADGEVTRRLWLDPDFRARVIAGNKRVHSDPEYLQRARETSAAQWADPSFRKRWMEQHRALWDDPESAADRRALLKKVWADPEKSARKSALVKSQWTPDRCAAMAENRRKAWADPEFKKRVIAKVAASKAAKKKNGRPEEGSLFPASELVRVQKSAL